MEDVPLARSFFRRMHFEVVIGFGSEVSTYGRLRSGYAVVSPRSLFTGAP